MVILPSSGRGGGEDFDAVAARHRRVLAVILAFAAANLLLRYAPRTLPACLLASSGFEGDYEPLLRGGVLKMSAKFSSVIIASMLLLGANGASQAAQPEGRYDQAGDLVFGVTSTTDGDPRLKEVADYVTAHITPWISDPLLVKTVNAQDVETKKLKQAQIDTLDIAWLERSDPELIKARMNNELSSFLKTKKAAGNGVILEIFVFDDKGLNVAQTDLTQDYVQGDEAKYWKSFGVGPDGMVIEKVAPDGGKPHISQASVAIKDPSTGKAIGAMTIGIDYDELAKTKK